MVTAGRNVSPIFNQTEQFRISVAPVSGGDAVEKGGTPLALVLSVTAGAVVGVVAVTRIVGLAWLCRGRASAASRLDLREAEEIEIAPTREVSSLRLVDDLLWEARWR
jgi:hypothetical protein